MAILLRELPAHLVSPGANKLTLESLKTIANSLVLEDPSSLDSSNAGDDLAPDDELLLRVETLEKVQDTRSLLVARRSKGTGISNHTSSVLDTEKTLLGRLTELLEALRSVRSTVETGVVGVELEELGAGNLEGILTLVEGKALIDAILGAEAEEDREDDLVLLGLDVTGTKETVLLDLDGLLVLLGNGNDGVTDVLGPHIHNLLDALSAGIAKSSPEITSLSVAVGVLLEVTADTLQEDILTEVSRDHAKNARALGVGNGIEDLVDLVSALDRDLNGVRAPEGVKSKSPLEVVGNISLPNLPLGVEDVARVPRGPGSETLVEPETIPPVHGD